MPLLHQGACYASLPGALASACPGRLASAPRVEDRKRSPTMRSAGGRKGRSMGVALPAMPARSDRECCMARSSRALIERNGEDCAQASSVTGDRSREVLDSAPHYVRLRLRTTRFVLRSLSVAATVDAHPSPGGALTRRKPISVLDQRLAERRRRWARAHPYPTAAANRSPAVGRSIPRCSAYTSIVSFGSRGRCAARERTRRTWSKTRSPASWRGRGFYVARMSSGI